MVTKRDFSMMSAEAGNLSLARITVESSDGGRGGFAGGGVYAWFNGLTLLAYLNYTSACSPAFIMFILRTASISSTHIHSSSCT